jgi:hypothetical protein
MAQQRHDYHSCQEQDCPRRPCMAWKEGREDGKREGRDKGYEDGYDDGVNACPREHRESGQRQPSSSPPPSTAGRSGGLASARRSPP